MRIRFDQLPADGIHDPPLIEYSQLQVLPPGIRREHKVFFARRQVRTSSFVNNNVSMQAA